MSIENYIIREKYINKFINLSQKNNDKYVKTRYNLFIKYLLGESIHSFPISDTYLSNIKDNNYDPFIIKTDLYSELNDLNNILNQCGLIKEIRKLDNLYKNELDNENKQRSELDEGQIIERNIKMIEDFKNEFGYDPTIFSILKFNNKDCFDNDNDANNDEDDIHDNHQMQDKIRDINNNKLNIDCNVANSKLSSDDVSENHNQTTQYVIGESAIKLDQNGSLESLNQLLDIFNLNFNDILKDIIQIDDNSVVVVSITVEEKPKKRITKKNQSQPLQPPQPPQSQISGIDTSVINVLDTELNNGKSKSSKNITTTLSQTDLVNEITQLIKKAEELNKTILAEQAKKDGVESLLKIADYYLNGVKLQKSTIKANMIYIYLTKKFNTPEAIYNLGDALINGSTIMKNHKQGTKLIKIAAETFKYQKAITRMKQLTRISLKSQKDEKILDDDEN
jgi:hypothetical protein